MQLEDMERSAIMEIRTIKEQICDVCHKMWQLGWVAANDGNVSAKLEDGTFLATPTGMSKSFITPEKLIRIDARGNVLEAAEGLRPSSEIKMHLRCYEKRDDVWSVIHAHPPGATGFAVAHRSMDMYNMIEDVAAIGSGGPYALAAARALTRHSDLDAESVARESMRIASEICVYTNGHLTVETL